MNTSPEQPPAPINVGTLAIAKRQMAVCDVGEMGVCYEVYSLENRPGYSFIFESGRHDGFKPAEIELMLTLPGVRCEELQDYRFRSVIRLVADFRAGLFAPAFAMLKNPH